MRKILKNSYAGYLALKTSGAIGGKYTRCIEIFEYKYIWRDRNLSSVAGMIEWADYFNHIKVKCYKNWMKLGKNLKSNWKFIKIMGGLFIKLIIHILKRITTNRASYNYFFLGFIHSFNFKISNSSFDHMDSQRAFSMLSMEAIVKCRLWCYTPLLSYM